jgi:hypothetical protein
VPFLVSFTVTLKLYRCRYPQELTGSTYNRIENNLAIKAINRQIILSSRTTTRIFNFILVEGEQKTCATRPHIIQAVCLMEKAL